MNKEFEKSKIITQKGEIKTMRQHIDESPVLLGREKFVKEYCEKKGWPCDTTKLSIRRIMEIREQSGWKNPL